MRGWVGVILCFFIHFNVMAKNEYQIKRIPLNMMNWHHIVKDLKQNPEKYISQEMLEQLTVVVTKENKGTPLQGINKNSINIPIREQYPHVLARYYYLEQNYQALQYIFSNIGFNNLVSKSYGPNDMRFIDLYVLDVLANGEPTHWKTKRPNTLTGNTKKRFVNVIYDKKFIDNLRTVINLSTNITTSSASNNHKSVNEIVKSSSFMLDSEIKFIGEKFDMFFDGIVEIFTNVYVWLAIVLFYILKNTLVFVPQNRGYVIYRLGKYDRTLKAGPNILVPFIEKIAADRNLKEQTLDIEPLVAVTKDNVTLTLDGILFIKVIDAAAATNNITDYKQAVIQLSMTSMRNAIGSSELDDCFQNRDEMNMKILEAMEEATHPWGVKVTRYEIKSITPPISIKEDMEKQMSAEREKRSVELTASGIKAAEITKAEGEKRSRILAAEAQKSEQVLLAEAQKQEQILDASGKAEAIRLVAQAEAKALEVVGVQANTPEGIKAVHLKLSQEAINAHSQIAKKGTVVLTDGNTGDNISKTVAQAMAVSSTVNSTETTSL